MKDAKEVMQSIWAFEGRRSRQSYAITTIAIFGIGFLAFFISLILAFVSPGFSLLFFSLIVIALSVASLTVGAQRIRDFDQSGCWVFLFLLPYVGFVLMIALAFIPPTPGDNRYGPSVVS